ncbi:MAG: sufurtransferase FdhD [Paenibacillus sp.]|jgi:FdhD protein|nr:sufurtransferase FdhD [Paenibacillus sp.]
MEELPVTSQWPIRRYKNDSWEDTDDIIVMEYPLTLYVNDREFATIVCTPDHLEQLIVGFLASEGVIRSMDDLENVLIDQVQGRAFVDLHQKSILDPAMFSKRRIASCCGKGRQSFYFHADAQTAKPLLDQGLRLTAQQCYALMKQLHQSAEVHRDTGGVHQAALSDGHELLAGFADIGRHNALDKLYGYTLMNSVTTADKVTVFSGRLASEVVLKAVKIGSPLLLSKSAPTDLALQLSEELGLTSVGFLRGSGMNVYTHGYRILD